MDLILVITRPSKVSILLTDERLSKIIKESQFVYRYNNYKFLENRWCSCQML